MYISYLYLLIKETYKFYKFCYFQKYQEYIQKFNHVDNTLEELGISKEYRRMQNFIRLILIKWCLISCMAWIYDSLLFITGFNDIKAILIHYVLNYFIYINTITDIMFVLLLRFVNLIAIQSYYFIVQNSNPFYK